MFTKIFYMKSGGGNKSKDNSLCQVEESNYAKWWVGSESGLCPESIFRSKCGVLETKGRAHAQQRAVLGILPAAKNQRRCTVHEWILRKGNLPTEEDRMVLAGTSLDEVK